MKREAAFELADSNEVLGNFCKKCNSTSFRPTFSRPDLDFGLLKEWATNPALSLMPQDEEALLADEQYLEMILQILDTGLIPDHKQNVPLEALCVILYDNSGKSNSRKDKI